jgi:hypothetical protein
MFLSSRERGAEYLLSWLISLETPRGESGVDLGKDRTKMPSYSAQVTRCRVQTDPSLFLVLRGSHKLEISPASVCLISRCA